MPLYPKYIIRRQQSASWTSIRDMDTERVEKSRMNNNSQYANNVLYGKKWAVCGDSFSDGDFSNALDSDYIITDGKYAGEKKFMDI